MKFTKLENILSEKGKVSPKIRTVLMDMVAKDPEGMFAKAKAVDKGKYEVEVHNATGNQTVYVRFEVSVSERSLTSLAEKKSKPKAKAKAEEDVEIE